MSLDFPNQPVNGQKYPDPAVVGLPQWSYDGAKRVWTSEGYGAGIFDPIRVEFGEDHLQVRFWGPSYSPRARDEFVCYDRNVDGTLTQIVAPDPYIDGRGLGGQLSVEGWPFSFDTAGGNTGIVPTPQRVQFPAESNAAIVVIEQKARVLHNHIRSSPMNNTHLSYYTRVAGLPYTGGDFTWKFPGSNITDEGATGPIVDNLPYISQLAMGHCPAMTGSDWSNSGADPDATLNGLQQPYRYGQDVNNYILAYCEFTPGISGYPLIQFYHNTRILRSKRSIFDISSPAMTFFPLIKAPGAPFPGVQSVGITRSGTGTFHLARTPSDISDVENLFFGEPTEENTLDEVTKDLRDHISRLVNGIQGTIDYDVDLSDSDRSLLTVTLQGLISLKKTPATPQGTLSSNINFIEAEIDRLVYENPDVMRAAGFVFPFEADFQNPDEIVYNTL